MVPFWAVISLDLFTLAGYCYLSKWKSNFLSLLSETAAVFWLAVKRRKMMKCARFFRVPCYNRSPTGSHKFN